MPLLPTDKFLVERAGTQYKMTAQEIADLIGGINNESVANIAERDALTDLEHGDRVFVALADDDPSVEFGWAIYRYDGTAFHKISEQESMDVIVSVDLTAVATAGNVTIGNSAGDPAIIPLATTALAGLMSPTDFARQHDAATADLAPASNPVIVDPVTQKVSFSISQLADLP